MDNDKPTMLTSLISLICLLAIGFFVMAITATSPNEPIQYAEVVE